MSEVKSDLLKGMDSEYCGRCFCEEAKARVQALEGKRVFQELIDEEVGHLNILCGQYSALEESGEWLPIEKASQRGAALDQDAILPEPTATRTAPANAADEDWLRLAMEFEREGYRIYHQAAGEADSPNEKATWEYLADSKDAHYAELQQTLDYLVNEGAWYYDDQEKPMFEG